MLALVLRTITYFYRLLLPVAGGVAISTAVIVGALVVGDSMRGSLRHIALDRIGSIQRIAIAPRWFEESALPEQESTHGMLMIDSVVAEYQQREADTLKTVRVTEMSLLGIADSFWSMGTVAPRISPQGEELVLNQALAEKLGVAVGDRVTLKVSRQAVVPADSALGKRDSETVALSRWKVVDILPDASLGRFSLRSDQRPVLNAFAPKKELQAALEIEGKINAVAVSVPSDALTDASENTSIGADASALESLRLSLDDLGLSWQHVRRVFPDTAIGESASDPDSAVIFDYDQITTDQMLLNDRLSESLMQAFSERAPQRILTYLANNAEVIRPASVDPSATSGRSVPYSTLSGLPWTLVQSMLERSGVSVDAPADENWVVLNQWIAEQMQARVGDRIRIDYYLPETVDGTEVEKQFEVRVVAIAPITRPESPYRRTSPARFSSPPTPFNDPEWTPDVPGITDQESISSWETPFPLERKIEGVDDEYWNEYRLTPKLFLSDELARKLFGSRFGDQTSLRFDGLSSEDRAAIGPRILKVARENLATLGWREIPLREQQLRAASGTTPFDALFLSLSFFVIAAAILLVAILFRLTIEKRADHWGLLIASGWTRFKVQRLLLLEAGLIAALGASLGVALGIGYAYAMLLGLRSWWVGAIAVSFLDFHVRTTSLWVGWLCGFLVSLVATWLVSGQLRGISAARLLKGRMDDGSMGEKAKPWVQWGAWMSAALGGIAMLVGPFVQGQAQAGAFVGSGMFLMIAGVLWLYQSLKKSDARDDSVTTYRPIGIGSLSRSNAQRSPVRSILTVALMAMASFLILSMSLFQAQPDRRGTGGFAFIAKSAQNIAINIGDPKQQRLALAAQADALTQTDIVSIRMRGGDDASCNNLFQANEPQIMGVPPQIQSIDRNAQGDSEFAWFATESAVPSPWAALEAAGDGTEDSPIPVILDQNTALWALHLGGYVGERFAFTLDQQRVHFRTVGVSQNTILQGSLWIGETNFQKLFPQITGYRLFLVKPNSEALATGSLAAIRSALEQGWTNEGLSCAPAADILSRLLAVQNTYLSAFQVLGALGLLLGTLGLGVTQLRGALERRSELAAMRAMGFSKQRLVWTLTLENGWQLIRGIGIGLSAAMVAAAPVLIQSQSLAAIRSPLFMLFGVLVLGMFFCIGAAVLAMRQPLLESLRADR